MGIGKVLNYIEEKNEGFDITKDTMTVKYDIINRKIKHLEGGKIYAKVYVNNSFGSHKCYFNIGYSYQKRRKNIIE